MEFLLDTHALLWFITNNPRLSSKARSAIEAGESRVFVSPASLWEIAIKVNIGKLNLDATFDTLFPKELDANEFKNLPIEIPHLASLALLPDHHSDPFDRMLIAQAQVEGLTIVTRDPQFPAYGVNLLW